MSSDPYTTLGVSPEASDAELRAAYRRLVQLHHPDHNGGSPESARRFEEIQDAYAHVRQLRAERPAATRATADPELDSRLAAMERELANERAAQAKRDLQAARERAQRAAREATAREATARASRPSDEELGYIKTDDSFSKILADAVSEPSGATEDLREQVREQHVGKRVSDLIDELGSRLGGGRSAS